MFWEEKQNRVFWLVRLTSEPRTAPESRCLCPWCKAELSPINRNDHILTACENWSQKRREKTKQKPRSVITHESTDKSDETRWDTGAKDITCKLLSFFSSHLLPGEKKKTALALFSFPVRGAGENAPVGSCALGGEGRSESS